MANPFPTDPSKDAPISAQHSSKQNSSKQNSSKPDRVQGLFTIALIVPFVSQIVIAVGLVGWLSFRNGQRAVNDVASQLRQENVARINQNLVSYLETPRLINQTNLDAINLGFLNINNPQTWSNYLWRQTKRSPSLNMVGFGSEARDFIATDQTTDKGTLMMSADASTSYNLQIHLLNQQGQREKIVRNSPNYDPRLRPWYQAVSSTRQPAWSQIFSHFSEPTLLIAHGLPIFDPEGKFQGVLASTLRLSQVGEFLQSLKIGQTGQTFIVERSGLLVASSRESSLVQDTSQTTNQVQRVKAIESRDLVTQKTTQHLLSTFGNLEKINTAQQLDFSLNNQKQFLQVVPFQNDQGLDWLIVVVVPEADFMSNIESNNRSTIILCILAAVVATLIGLVTSHWLSRPIIRLAAAARAVANGSWDQSLPIEREDELGIMAEAFNRMAAQLRQSLQEMEAREASLAEAQKVAHMGSWQLDLVTQKVTWSQEMFRIYGLEGRAAAPPNEEALQLVYPDDRILITEAFRLIPETKQPFSIEYRIMRPNGEIRYVQGKGQPIWDKQQQVVGTLGTVMDITDQKQAEMALRASEAELREKTDQLQSLIIQLQKTQTQLVQTEKMSSLGQMVAGIAHEINNPVSFIHGNINYAQQYTNDLLKLMQIVQDHQEDLPIAVQEAAQEIDVDFLTVDLPKLMRSMQVGAERIQQIVISLRNFSRLDESAIKSVDLHEGIDSTLMLLQHRLKANQDHPEIIVVREYAALPLVECYAGQLNQVFMNLLVNAIDALETSYTSRTQTTDEALSYRPTIWIVTQVIDSTTVPPKEVTEQNRSMVTERSRSMATERSRSMVTPQQITMRIRDNGSGISPEHQKKLFDPFFTTKPIGRGTGLGLAISYQIVVDRHGGELTFSSQPGEGTEFIITIPVHQKKTQKTTTAMLPSEEF
ncbi:MAG: PAS domain-containing protein [Coleofasciculaceae cyanobacterium SM2_1_6]|nr:PAS domain-containing protein [Coleofasciculaceae cyanobacterium SM2_1_6]